GFLPAYYESLAPLSAYLSRDVRVVLTAPAEITRAVREDLERVTADAAAKAEEPSFIVGAHYLTEEEAAKDLEGRQVFALHATAALGTPQDGLAAWETTLDAEPLHLAASDNEDITRAVKAARASKGKTNAIAPVARRILHFRDQGLRVI